MPSLVKIVGDRILKLGSTGSAVEAIQFRLRDLGYALKGTGFYGPATDTAVSAFQRRAGIRADGEVGAITAAALDAAVVSASSITAGTGPAVPSIEIGRPLWLEAGIKLIGTTEAAGARENPTIIDWAKEEGGDIAKAYTHDSIPWCSLFANHILTKVGIKGTETLWALDFAGKWPAVRLDGPAVGAFAPMLRDGGGHIICIAGRTGSGLVAGLGGNQHDAVNISGFPLSRLNKGFWWPAGVPLPALIGFDHLPIVTSSGRVSTRES